MQRFFKISILDRYILKELLSPFVFGVCAFTFVLAGSTILFQLIGEAVKYQIPFIDFGLLFLFKLPYVIALSFPMSMLLSAIMAFGRMGNDLEILAFRASGIPVYRLVVPVVIAGLFVSVMTVWFNESVVPRASRSAEDLFISYRDREDPTIKQNINLTEYEKGLPKRIINVAEVDKGLLKHVTVAEYEAGFLVRLIRSDSGRWLSQGGWEFYDGVMHNFSLDNNKRVTIIEFSKEYIDIKINPLDVNNRELRTEEVTRKQLKDKIKYLKATGQDPLKDLMDYHMKLSVAFSSLIYSILGASLGLRPHRSSSAMGFGISFGIILGYVVLLSVGMGLGISGTVAPVIAAWFPNVVVGIAGLILLNKASDI